MKRLALITFVLGAALALVPVASAVVATDGVGSSTSVVPSTPVGMTQAEYRALMIRSEALNKLYGTAVTKLSPSEFASLYNSGGSSLSPEELAATVARGEELNARFGNSITDLTPQQFKQAYETGIANATKIGTTTVSQAPDSGTAFDWRYVAIAALGAVLLAYASMATRRRHQLGF